MENLIEVVEGLNEGDDLDEGPSGKRWPPLGAASENACPDFNSRVLSETERLRDLEEQQELLNSSLIALSTHFAQVQFRLRQIVDAPAEDKELLLRDLEEFAFRGIPEIPDRNGHGILRQDSEEFEAAITAQRAKQKELIMNLKTQLAELEHYAYQMGEAGLPQNVIMEKQKLIIDELKYKLNLNMDDIDELTLDDIRHQVDRAVNQLVNPLKMKEQLVIQLKTQIVDLERFIDFLQGESDAWGAPGGYNFIKSSSCKCSHETHASHKTSAEERDLQGKRISGNRNFTSATKSEVKDHTVSMIRRAAALLQLFAVSQFGCGATLKMNTSKKSTKIYHWGDMRARLELAVVNVLALASDDDYQDGCEYVSDNDSVAAICNVKMTMAVRKQLALSIRDLMQHGLASVERNSSLVPFMGCLSVKNKDTPTMHAWELILKYYELKNGARFNSTPVRKLSQSFNLNIVGSKAVSNKQNMLGAVGNIISVHTQFKRSYDAHFKAFICAALKKLVVWLRLIFRCQPLIKTYYEPWSYVAKTGFEDSLQSLDKLSHIKFDLPVDIAVHQFQNIKDAF